MAPNIHKLRELNYIVDQIIRWVQKYGLFAGKLQKVNFVNFGCLLSRSCFHLFCVVLLLVETLPPTYFSVRPRTLAKAQLLSLK